MSPCTIRHAALSARGFARIIDAADGDCNDGYRKGTNGEDFSR